MIGFYGAIDSMGASDGACVGDGVVGEIGRAMRSSFGERNWREGEMSDGGSKSI